jgi:hypothetical protein
MTIPRIIPGVTIEVVAPFRPSEHLKAPWLLVDGPQGASLSTPGLTREAPAALRKLAQEIDEAWAIMDRRATLAGSPEDPTQFTNLNPAEDAAMGNLSAGLPSFAPHMED